MEEKYISQYLIFQQHCEFGEMENQRIKIKKKEGRNKCSTQQYSNFPCSSASHVIMQISEEQTSPK